MPLEFSASFRASDTSNVIDVHVKEIRRKLARAGGAGVIATVRGAGYRLEEPA